MSVLTIAEVADLYRCHPDTIRRAVQRGEIDSVRVLGVVRIPATALPAALTLPHTAVAVAAVPPGSAAGAGTAASGAAGASQPIQGAGEQTPAVPPTLNGGST